MIASTDTDQFGASTDVDKVIEYVESADEDDNKAFRSALEDMQSAGLFGNVEIAALRLAAVRKESQLTTALTDYHDGALDSTGFKEALLDVVERVVAETESKM